MQTGETQTGTIPTWTGLDRWLNFTSPPAFLAAIGPKDRSWWRILLVIAAIGVGFLAVSFVTMGVAIGLGAALLAAFGAGGPSEALGVIMAMADPGGGSIDTLLEESVMVLTLGVTFGGLTLSVLGALRLMFGRPMRTWITAAPRFRWRLMLAGLLLYCAVLAVYLLIAVALGDDSIRPPLFDSAEPIAVRLTYLAIVLLALPVAAAFEEILCRGWLMQQTAAFTRNVIPILLVNGLIFSALHLDPDLGRNVSRLATGLVLSWAALRLGGLEFSIGAHTANNLMIALFMSTLSSNLDTSVVTTWGAVAVDLLASAVLVVVIEAVARWTPLRRWTGAEVSSTAAAAPVPSA